MLEIKFTDV